MTAHAGWRPGRLDTFASIDLRTLDPSSGVPRQAHKRWLRRVDAGKQRCLGCWHPLRFGTARHPLLLGVVTLAEAVNLMAMCLSCAGGHAFDQAGAVMYEAAIGQHGADRVLVHKLAR